MAEFPLNYKKRWDIEVGDVAIELDEQQHFNRYRRLTLDSPVYSRLPSFPLADYRRYCDTREAECSDTGATRQGFWSNTSCDKQCGTASLLGHFSGNGSSRWKQRAFYDLVKDLAPLALDVRLARVAVWDIVAVGGREVTVEQVLRNPPPGSAAAIVALIEQRAGVRLS